MQSPQNYVLVALKKQTCSIPKVKSTTFKF